MQLNGPKTDDLESLSHCHRVLGERRAEAEEGLEIPPGEVLHPNLAAPQP